MSEKDDREEAPKEPEGTPAGAPRPPGPETSQAGPASAKPAGDTPPPRPAAKVDPVEQALRSEVSSVPLERLRALIPDAIEETSFYAGVPIVRVSRDSVVRVCHLLKEDPECDMKYLSNLCGAHYPDRPEPFEVVYHLYSITRGHRIALKVRTTEAQPVPTVTVVWRTANWHEREAYDMYGIRFDGHPDLTRILLPDDWEGHPLRKEYPLEGKPGDHKMYRRE